MNEDQLATALTHYFDNPQIQSFEPISQGHENTSIKLVLASGEKLIFRVWGLEHSHIGVRSENDIIAELAFMTHCYEAGLPVPKIYASKNAKQYKRLPSGEFYVIMDFVPGESPQDFTPDMVEQVAVTMAKMHNLAADFKFPVPRSWPGTAIDMTNEWLTEYADDIAKLRPGLQAHLREVAQGYRDQQQTLNLAALPTGPIHGDIFWENIKFEDGKLAGIFDFDDCRTSYFLEDLVKTLLYDFDDPVHGFYGHDGGNVDIFLAAYQSTRQLSNAESVALPFFLTVGYLYRFTTYIRRCARGEDAYLIRLDTLMQRYEQNRNRFVESESLSAKG